MIIIDLNRLLTIVSTSLIEYQAVTWAETRWRLANGILNMLCGYPFNDVLKILAVGIVVIIVHPRVIIVAILFLSIFTILI